MVAALTEHLAVVSATTAGLAAAVKFLEPIKEKVPLVSWADLMQMASALAVEVRAVHASWVKRRDSPHVDVRPAQYRVIRKCLYSI